MCPACEHGGPGGATEDASEEEPERFETEPRAYGRERAKQGKSTHLGATRARRGCRLQKQNRAEGGAFALRQAGGDREAVGRQPGGLATRRPVLRACRIGLRRIYNYEPRVTLT